MTQNSCKAVVLAVIAVALLPAGSAQAQWYSSVSRQPPPLYPYAVQGDKPHAAEAAPNKYVAPRPAAPRLDRPHRRADRKLIEELRRRSKSKTTAIDTRRYVDDPPRTIERRHVADAKKATPKGRKVADSDRHKGKDDSKKRVIAADAEITILGPDRMSIQLFRKGGANKAKASAE